MQSKNDISTFETPKIKKGHQNLDQNPIFGF